MATDFEQTTAAKTCRERKPNFSDAEIGLILEGIYKNRDLINNTETSISINRQKNAVYRLITERVNEITRFEYGGSVERNVRDVKKKWIELKYTALKIHNARLSGNGLSKTQQSKYVPKESPFTQFVLDIVFGTDISGRETELRMGHNAYNRSGPGRRNSITVPSVSSGHGTRGDSRVGSGIQSNSEMSVIKTEAEECLGQVHGSPHDGVSREVTLCTVKPETVEMERTQNFTDVDNSRDSDYAEVSLQMNVGHKERDRKQNFTEVEIATLLREVNKHKDVILMKDQNVEAVKLKHQKWMQILEQCHKSRTTGVKRTVSEIQKKWRNLKLLAMRERKASEKATLKGRSSGYSESRYTEQIIAILDGTTDDGPVTEVQEVDFEAMLTWDASTNQNQSISLLHRPDTSQSFVLDDNVSAKKKQKGKDEFSDAEIHCLLKEIPKHYKILGKKLQTDRINRWKELHWQIITDKVNACSDREIARSWREVQKKFKALKLAALADQNQRLSDESRISETNSSNEYNRLVLDILNGTSTATKICSEEDMDTGEDDISSNNQHQEDAERECGFPKRNPNESATVSLEECECLVSEVDKFKDILLVTTASETGNLRQKQHRAWRIATENVNKCSARGFRWTAKELKQNWLELKQNVECYQRAVAQGVTDLTEPALFHRITGILQTLSSTSKNNELTALKQSVEAGNGNDSDSEDLSQGISHSTPKHPILDKQNKANDSITDNGANEVFPDSQKDEDTVSHENHDDLEEDEFQDDVLDVDYTPTARKESNSKRQTTSGSSRVHTGPPYHIRVRKPNFSESEVRIILDVYEANKDVMNCEKKNSDTHRKKLRIWQCMVEKINNFHKSAGRMKTTRRTVKQVRKKLNDLRATAIKTLVSGGVAAAKERPSCTGQSFVERVIKVMNIDMAEPEAFEIYHDIAEEDGDEVEGAENLKGTRNDSSMAIQKHLDSLVHICGELKALGVDVGAMVFEKDTVMSCGSERMMHIATHPQLSDVLSAERYHSSSTEKDRQSVHGDWKVTVLKSATATAAGSGSVVHSASSHNASTEGTVLDSHSLAMMEVSQSEPQVSRTLDSQDERDNIVNNVSDRVDDQSGENSLDVEFSALDSTCSDESSERASVKQKLKAMLLNRSSDTDDTLDASREQLSDMEFTPVGFHLQQPRASVTNSEKVSFTCNLCPASFPYLSTLTLHKRSHNKEEGRAEGRDGLIGRGQQLDEASGWQKNPVVLLQKLPLDIVNRTSVSCQPDVDQSKQVGSQPRYKKGAFACRQCGKRFTKHGLLKIHLQLHLSGRLLTCSSSSDTFTSGGRPVLHRKAQRSTSQLQTQTSDTDPGLVILDDKGDDNNGDNDTDGLMTNNENSEDLSILQQEKPENSEEATKEQLVSNAKDTRERRFPCKFCGKRFFTTTHRRQHERIHTGERPFKCDICGFCFTQSASLTIHKRKHTGERPYACDLCGYTFYCSSDVLAHKKKRHGLVISKRQTHADKYKCDVCGRVFLDISRLKTHTRKHTGEKPFSCDLCPRTFTEKHNLVRHKERHLGIKPFQCHICGTKFTEKGNLKVHMRYHSGEKPFKCEFCGEGFYVTSTLKIHRRKHTGERPYLCDLCGASFTQGGKLHSHRRKHTGEKPYKCSECGENFKEKDQLNIHRRKHTGIQPYTCKMCGKALQKASHLANHIRVHTGEKPFACEICGEKFARTDVLGLHRKKHLNFAQLQNPGHHSQTSHPDQTSQPDQTSHPSQEIQPSQTIHEQQGMLSQGDVESQAVASASMPHVFVSPVVLPVVELAPANYQHM